ncbi:MAG: peptidoglycan synthetase [Bacteroidota bacterium]|nr:MAG: peptidoglycan synthetase [Bacteroidota bacterium]
MKIHFIAIGGAAMHNLALALLKKNYTITGSDDEIFEPSRTRLEKAGLLPDAYGWFPERIHKQLDAVILGMHAREDNPELIRARELNLKIYSYPEFLYQQTQYKKRVVIGGSHGKTTVTSMIMHVLKKQGMAFDYMVGAQIEGFETMVSLSDEATIAVFEGDEYLSSPIDRRPKFHLYYPHIALINGIGWDHINVFPTFEVYLEQFKIFIDKIMPQGILFYFEHDTHLQQLVKNRPRTDIKMIPFSAPASKIEEGITHLHLENKKSVALEVFGAHNLQNLAGAREVCLSLGIGEEAFYDSIGSFKGSAKRLQKIFDDKQNTIFLDFAHSPSKVAGTIEAVKNQYPIAEIVAVYELHTFSSLNKEFLAEYHGSLDGVTKAAVFFNPQVIEHKKLPPISPQEVVEAFGNEEIEVITDTKNLKSWLQTNRSKNRQIVLLMSSGNFGGIDSVEFVSLFN